jgi:hypothetical protein
MGSAGAEPKNGMEAWGSAWTFQFPFPHAVESTGSGSGKPWGIDAIVIVIAAISSW